MALKSGSGMCTVAIVDLHLLSSAACVPILCDRDDDVCQSDSRSVRTVELYICGLKSAAIWRYTALGPHVQIIYQSCMSDSYLGFNVGLCEINDGWMHAQNDVWTTRMSAVADCTALRVWNVKRASFLLGVGAFMPKNIREQGHPLTKCWHRSIGSWLRYNFAARSF